MKATSEGARLYLLNKEAANYPLLYTPIFSFEEINTQIQSFIHI